MPLTLAILNAVLVEVGGTRFALSRQTVEEIVAVDQAQVRIDRLRRRCDGGGARRAPAAGGAAAPDLRRRARRAPPPRRRHRAGGKLRARARRRDRGTGTGGEARRARRSAPPASTPARCCRTTARPSCCSTSPPSPRAPACASRRKVEDVAEAVVAAAVSTLLFEDVDGARRLLPAEAVDRIERPAPADVTRAAGALWLTCDGRSIPVWTGSGARDPADVSTVLRLQIDDRELAYPVRQAIEIVPLPAATTPVDSGAAVALAIVEGAPVELLDPIALFDLAARAPDVARPLCFLHGSDSPSMEAFLRPTIEAAGYRVARTLAPGETAQVALAMADDTPPAVPAIRLGRHRGEGLYRYDRAALAQALQEARI
ncbi:hypothetical protein AB5I41_00625 [Sphingomonas sp. MMS24-JH45]